MTTNPQKKGRRPQRCSIPLRNWLGLAAVACCTTLTLLQLPDRVHGFSPHTPATAWRHATGSTRLLLLPARRGGGALSPPMSSSQPLSARKKRRRRKEDGTKGSSPSADDSDELPDFDLGDDTDGDVSSSTSAQTTRRSSNKDNTSDPLGVISDNMMGSVGSPTRSVRELLNDRALEQKFEFDEEDTANNGDNAALPDLAVVAPRSSSSNPPPLGRKQARRAAAQAAAAEAQAKEEEFDLLKALPLIRDEQGEISVLKILENATWVCIGLLVVWEIYINSPFFERAAPMAPIVYQ